MDQKPNEIRVVSAVADKKQAVLYLESGEQLVLKQGDHRLGDLLDIIIPITTRGEVAVVSLQDFSIYAAFEQKSQGLTKFFRMAKDKVKGFFGGQTNTHETHIPEEGKKAILRAVAGESMTEEEVIEHGKPIDPTDMVGNDEVVVAVVTTPATETAPAKKTVIPGVQNLKPLIDHAVKTNSVGVQAFLARCAQFIDKRQHSVDDLMRFLEKGDLPLADDGSIIAYKMLNIYHSDPSKQTFVDCHSGKIQQRVGSYVCVNESLVDLNRRTECSNGLHIARRGYLSGFGGAVCVLCKIDPEDVMVVPHNDANKVRVKGYHILGVLSDAAMAALKDNKPMTADTEALSMVYNAIKGNHIDRIERVQVNGQMGSNVVVTKLKHDKLKERGGSDHTGSDLKNAAALDDEVNLIGSVDPREINKKVNEAHSQIIGNNPGTIIPDEIEEGDGVEEEFEEDGDIEGTGDEDEADDSTVEEDTEAYKVQEAHEVGEEDLKAASELHDEIVDRLAAKPAEPEAPKKTGIAAQMEEAILDFQTSPDDKKQAAAQAIIALKRSAKKSWASFMVKQKLADEIIAIAGGVNKPAKVSQAPKAGAKEKKSTSAPKSVKTAPNTVKTNTASKRTKADEARDLYDRWVAGNAPKDLTALLKFKKSAKKGWTALGFSEAQIRKIEAGT